MKKEERLKTYWQDNRQPALQQIDVESHITRCGKKNFKMMPFLTIREDNKILRVTPNLLY